MGVQTGKVEHSTQVSIARLLGVFLVLAVVTQYSQLPEAFGYAIVAVVYLGICLLFLTTPETRISLRKRYLVLICLLIVTATLSTLVNANVGSTVRLFSLFLFTLVNFLVIPRIIPLHQFLTVISRLSAMLVILGLMPYFGFAPTIPIFDLSLWGSPNGLRPAAMTSVFSNPNTMGFFAFVGTVSAFGNWLETRSLISGLCGVTSLVGLLLTQNRSAWLATFIVGLLIGTYLLVGRRWLVISIISGLSATVLFLFLLFGILPGPETLTEFSLTGRRELWVEGVQVFLTEPFFGRGLAYGGIHNSYIRMFAALGIVGGIVYLLLSVTTAIQNARETNSMRSLIITILLTGFIFVQLFEGVGFIGTSLHSTLISVVMGYHISGIAHEYQRF